ncbi:hypothetical protein GCM10009657_16030 [Oryzihumus leptocrescens]
MPVLRALTSAPGAGSIRGQQSWWGRWWLPVAAWTVVVVYSVHALASLYGRPEALRFEDLHVYTGSLNFLREGRNPYDFQASNGDPFTYPPAALLLFLPLMLLDLPQAELVWTVVTFILTGLLAWVTMRALRSALRLSVGVPLVTLVLLWSAPLQSNLRFGQVSILIVLLCAVDLFRRVPGKLSGLLIGVAAAVKLTPLIFIAWLLFCRRWREAAVAMTAFVGSSVVAAVLWPAVSERYWLHDVAVIGRIGDLSLGGNQSLQGVLLRSGATEPATLHALWVALSICIAILSFYRARVIALESRVLATCVIGCAGLLVSPVSWSHHQVWTVLAGVAMLTQTGRLVRSGGAVTLVLMLLSPSQLPGYGAVGLTWLWQNGRALIEVVIAALLPLRPRQPLEEGPGRRPADYGHETTTPEGAAGRMSELHVGL